MSLRTDLAPILARDARYSVEAYVYVLEALEFAKAAKRHARSHAGAKRGGEPKRPVRATSRPSIEHVTGQELCHGARELARRRYGLMALTVLHSWGIHSTSDLGNIVYNLIASGDLEKTPQDSRSDFDNVFDLEAALAREYTLPREEQ
jgi:uncharacterized repeat protein (TIGR04138 family)